MQKKKREENDPKGLILLPEVELGQLFHFICYGVYYSSLVHPGVFQERDSST